MSHPLLKLEPLIWVLFGQGIMIGSMLLTGWLLVVGILAPLGLVPAEALAWVMPVALARIVKFRDVLLVLVMVAVAESPPVPAVPKP